MILMDGMEFLALERESYNRETFCIAFNEFIPRLDYRGNMEQIANQPRCWLTDRC